jgi:hypothetical protein
MRGFRLPWQCRLALASKKKSILTDEHAGTKVQGQGKHAITRIGKEMLLIVYYVSARRYVPRTLPTLITSEGGIGIKDRRRTDASYLSKASI